MSCTATRFAKILTWTTSEVDVQEKPVFALVTKVANQSVVFALQAGDEVFRRLSTNGAPTAQLVAAP